MKFKLSKKSRVLLGVGIFLIALLSLCLAQLQQTQIRARAQQEMAQVGLIIEKLANTNLVTQKEELAERLNVVKDDLVAAKSRLKQSLETIETSDDIYDIAWQSNVTITRIDSSAPDDNGVGGVNCSMITVTVRADGAVADLIDFVAGLTEKYGTAMVASAVITVPGVADAAEGEGDSGGSEEDGSVEEEAEEPRLVVTLLIYDYRGD